MGSRFITQRSATEFVGCIDLDVLEDHFLRLGWQHCPTERLGELWRIAYDDAVIVAAVGVVKCAGPNWQHASDALSELATPVSDAEVTCLARAYTRLARYAAERRASMGSEAA